MRNFLTIRIAVSVSLLFTAAAHADHDESVTKEQTIEFIVGQVQENCIDRSFEDWKRHDSSDRTQILEFNISGDKAMFRYAFRYASDGDTAEDTYSASINLDELSYDGMSSRFHMHDKGDPGKGYHGYGDPRFYYYTYFLCRDEYANCINHKNEEKKREWYETEFEFYGCPSLTDETLARAFKHLIFIYDQSREKSLF